MLRQQLPYKISNSNNSNTKKTLKAMAQLHPLTLNTVTKKTSIVVCLLALITTHQPAMAKIFGYDLSLPLLAKTQHKIAPPKLQDIQIRNYHSVPTNQQFTFQPTPAKDLGYGNHSYGTNILALAQEQQADHIESSNVTNSTDTSSEEKVLNDPKSHTANNNNNPNSDVKKTLPSELEETAKQKEQDNPEINELKKAESETESQADPLFIIAKEENLTDTDMVINDTESNDIINELDSSSQLEQPTESLSSLDSSISTESELTQSHPESSLLTDQHSKKSDSQITTKPISSDQPTNLIVSTLDSSALKSNKQKTDNTVNKDENLADKSTTNTELHELTVSGSITNSDDDEDSSLTDESSLLNVTVNDNDTKATDEKTNHGSSVSNDIPQSRPKKQSDQIKNNIKSNDEAEARKREEETETLANEDKATHQTTVISTDNTTIKIPADSAETNPLENRNNTEQDDKILSPDTDITGNDPIRPATIHNHKPDNHQADHKINSQVIPKPPKLVLPDIPPLKESDPQKTILENARKHSEKSNHKSINHNQAAASIPDIPAFRKLMNTGIDQLKNDQLTNAENSFTKAQRMLPQSSAVYFYLGQVALKKQQPRKAEAMARRGLVVSDSINRKQSLWQLILKSAQMLGNKKIIREAKRALR